jgi:hypothetical protein
MARRFLTPINLSQLELENPSFQKLASDPTSPVTGQFYYNTVSNLIKFYNGESWIELRKLTTEEVQDLVNGLIFAGNGISSIYNDNSNTLTISNTGVTSLIGTADEVTVSASAGAVTLSLPEDITVQNLVVSGALTVSGSATYINTEIVTIDDNIIVLNSNSAGSPTLNAGVEIERGTSTNVSILWNESSDNWTLSNDGTNFHGITRKHSSNIGNGSSTQFSITHNLNTRDVSVQVYDNATFDTVDVDVVRTDVNTVTLTFSTAPSTNSYRVLVVG